ncbi:MAG: hypothetical protein ACOVNU_00220 [Candidatus Kapaibacteriota bacterium]|jgi:hypothetical protein
MTFEKITLFSNDISREFEIFTKLGFECIEQNKAYYKFIINNTIFSINNRQKAVFTNYLLKFELDVISFELVNSLKFENYTTFKTNKNENIEIESNDKNGFLFQFSKSNKELQNRNEKLNYNLISLNCNTEFVVEYTTEIIENVIISNNIFDIKLNSDNSKLSQNTPISILTNKGDFKENLIFSGKGLVTTKI